MSTECLLPSSLSPDSSPCPVCGAPRVGPHCDACDLRLQLTLIRREALVLALLTILAIAGFFVTRLVADANMQMRLRDAAAWYREGDGQMASGRFDAAVSALRRAAAIDRNNASYRLALASAHSARGEDGLARQVLLGIRELAPESVAVNLQLARIEARRNDTAAAVDYYRNALHGQWDADQLLSRPRTRVELIRYLLDHGDQAQALPELLVLSANLTDAGPTHTEMGQLFVAAGDLRRALGHFERAIAADPTNGIALEAAGAVTFALGDFAAADRYLRAAPPTDATLTLRTVTRLVLTTDPLAPRLSTRDRRLRLEGGVARARSRIDTCLAPTAPSVPMPDGVAGLAALAVDTLAFERALTALPLSRTAEVLDEGVRLIWQVENAAAAVCGPPDEAGQAVLLIGRRHGVEAP